ncbi:hypothetical protein NFI96_030885, partial [Prochilodus magdalenae]
LRTSYTSMTKEREQLQTSYTSLTPERDQLQAISTNLINEMGQLQKEKKALQKKVEEIGTLSLSDGLEKLGSWDPKACLFESGKTVVSSCLSSCLFYAVVCWGGSIKKRDEMRLDKLVRRAGCYRAAAVCLGLLCVLLLAAVTVLWIQFNNMTKERDQLQKEQEAHRKLLSALEQGQRYFDQSFYFITIEKLSWRESRRYCQDKGADLVIIKSRDKQEFIDKAFGRTNSWIGLTDVDSEGSWKWVDGSALTSLEFWWPGEPNDEINEDCAGTDVKNSGSSWNDFVCDLPMVGICEKPLKPDAGRDQWDVAKEDYMSSVRKLNSLDVIELSKDNEPKHTSPWLGFRRSPGRFWSGRFSRLTVVEFEKTHINQLGWRYFNSSLYYISTERKSWEESKQDCIKRGADLVIINSREEQ